MSDLILELRTAQLPTSNRTRKEHWRTQAASAAALRRLVALKARNLAPVATPARLVATIGYGDRIRRDLDNVSLKAITDGIVDAGVIPDDDWTHLAEVTRRAGDIHKRRGIVTIHLAISTLSPPVFHPASTRGTQRPVRASIPGV